MPPSLLGGEAPSAAPTAPAAPAFLFTDIEGSTRLWEEHPGAMAAALARHDALVFAAVTAAGGRVFKHTGDGVLAAFPGGPAGAVRAALEAQRALLAEPWPSPEVRLRARMAVHAGPAEARGGDFFGPTLNRAARLLAAGHGTQVLVSGAAAEAAMGSSSLPDGASLLDQGQHRLKDLLLPERIFLLAHPDLPSGLPPLRTLASQRHNLPVQATSFIGREAEMAGVKRMLGAGRLVTLLGPGGAGKTRLALQAAADLLDSYPDGVFFVDLAPLADPGLVPQAAADALGLRPDRGGSASQAVADALRRSRALLLLDNCEHVVDAAARFADLLLRSCEGVRLLATSRETLNIDGEHVYRVPSLSLPEWPSGDDGGAPAAAVPPEGAVLPEAVTSSESGRLFLERAAAASPDFALSRGNAFAVARVCRRLDGIPLAIEMAAARTRVLSPQEIDRRLDDRFRLLTAGSRTALPRQQTLRALIDWSYDLLPEPERALLCRLSVFVGGWTLPAAEAVCAGEGMEEADVMDLLASLADKSLVTCDADAQTAGEARYRLLETVRQYASQRLEEREGAAGVTRLRDRHAAHFGAVAERTCADLFGTPRQAEGFRWMEAETDNLRAAQDHWAATGNAAGLLAMVRDLYQWWASTGRTEEGLRRVDRAVALGEAGGDSVPTILRTAARLGGAMCAQLRGDFGQAESHLEAGLALARRWHPERAPKFVMALGLAAAGRGEFDAARAHYKEALSLQMALGDRAGEATTRNHLASLLMERGEPEEALPHVTAALAFHRDADNPRHVASCLHNLGAILGQLGDHPASEAAYRESIALRQGISESINVANTLDALGTSLHAQGDMVAARAMHEEALAMRRRFHNLAGIGYSLANLGALVLVAGEPEAARRYLSESMRSALGTGDRRLVAYVLLAFAHLSQEEGAPERAARLWGTSAVMLSSMGIRLSGREREEDATRRGKALAALGGDADAFAALEREGADLPEEQAVALALEPPSGA